MPSVVIDATGSLKAINSAVRYMSHGARYVSIGLQKGDTSFSHPEFRKREEVQPGQVHRSLNRRHVIENKKEQKGIQPFHR